MPLPQTLQSALDEARKKATVIRASASVMAADQPIWIGVSGMSDPTTETPITPDMLFDIGSIGKNFLATLIPSAMHSVSKRVTSILVGIAVDQGLIGVNDPVHVYFNDYRGLEWIDKPYPITIENLLAMAHGTDWDERIPEHTTLFCEPVLTTIAI